MPIKTRSSAPRLRSTISWAIRVSARWISAASMTVRFIALGIKKPPRPEKVRCSNRSFSSVSFPVSLGQIKGRLHDNERRRGCQDIGPGDRSPERGDKKEPEDGTSDENKAPQSIGIFHDVPSTAKANRAVRPFGMSPRKTLRGA